LLSDHEIATRVRDDNYGPYWLGYLDAMDGTLSSHWLKTYSEYWTGAQDYRGDKELWGVIVELEND
jgi:hypothetical protein